MKNGQSRETGNIVVHKTWTKTNKTEGLWIVQSSEKLKFWYTRHRTKTNKTEGQSSQLCTKLSQAIKNGQSRETGNIWYTRHRTKTNKTEGQ